MEDKITDESCSSFSLCNRVDKARRGEALEPECLPQRLKVINSATDADSGFRKAIKDFGFAVEARSLEDKFIQNLNTPEVIRGAQLQ